MGRRIRCLIPFVVLSTLVSVHSGADAQDGFNVNHLRPAPSLSGGYFSAHDPHTLPSLEWEVGAGFGYASDLLVYVLEDGTESDVVGSQATVDVFAAVGFADRFELGLVTPLILSASGDAVEIPDFQVGEMTGGIGDIRVVGRALFFSQLDDTRRHGVAFGASLTLGMPTGTRDAFQGSGFTGEPRINFSYTIPQGTRIAFNTGYLIREQQVFPGLEIGDALTWTLAASVPVIDRFEALVEVFGETPIGLETEDVTEAHYPFEGIVGGRYQASEEFTVQLGFGRGFTGGYGAPTFRAFLGASYHGVADSDRDDDGIENTVDDCPDAAEDFDDFADGDGCPDEDNDQDRVPDIHDECRDVAEDDDDFEDEDGCPELDDDGDEIPDEVDECPLEPEDFDGWADEDGCPEDDADGDEVLDDADACPGVAEDLDGFDDTDGCPDPDNDLDGFPDEEDECRDLAEVVNGVDDLDGCPDESAIAVDFEAGVVRFDDPILFSARTAEIASSTAPLDLLVSAMRSRLDLELHIVVGTRERSAMVENQQLAAQRAVALRQYLVDAGIAGSRITTDDGEIPPETSPTPTVVEFQIR